MWAYVRKKLYMLHPFLASRPLPSWIHFSLHRSNATNTTKEWEIEATPAALRRIGGLVTREDWPYKVITRAVFVTG